MKLLMASLAVRRWARGHGAFRLVTEILQWNLPADRRDYQAALPNDLFLSRDAQGTTATPSVESARIKPNGTSWNGNG
jgi:hypothetical protein